MDIKLVDYDDVVAKINIDDKKLENFLFAKYKVVSGDEVLEIIYKDGTEDYFDSCHSIRTQTFIDEEINLIDIEELVLIKKLRIKPHKDELCFSSSRAYELQDLVNEKRGAQPLKKENKR